jgi:hypothetical protein
LQGQTEIIEVETTNSCSELLLSGSYDQEGCELVPSNFVLNNMNGSKLPMNCSYFWEMLEALMSLEDGRDPKSLSEKHMHAHEIHTEFSFVNIRWMLTKVFSL